MFDAPAVFSTLFSWPIAVQHQAACIVDAWYTSTLMPGPMVGVMVMRRIYCPLALAGLARCTASISAAKFSNSLLLAEAGAAYRHVDVGSLVQPKLHTSGFEFPDHTHQVSIGDDGAGFGAGHQTTRAEADGPGVRLYP